MMIVVVVINMTSIFTSVAIRKEEEEEEEERQSQEPQEELEPDPAVLLEAPEDRTWPWVKWRTVAGTWGQRQERFTLDKTLSPTVKRPPSPKDVSPGVKAKCPEP